MSQKISDTNILTGEPLISSTPPLILLQSEEDLTSDLSPNQTSENPSSSTIDSTSDVTLIASKADDTGISSSNAGSRDPVPNTENSKPTSSGTASSSVHDESWNIENLLTEDKNPFSTLTEEHLSRLEDVLSSEEVRSFLQQTQLQELSSGLAENPVVSSATGAGAVQAGTSPSSDDPLKLDVFQNQASASCSLIDDALAGQVIEDGVREHDLAAMAAAFIDHAYALPYVDAFTDSTTSSPRKSARIKQRADDGKSAYDSDFEYYLTSSRRGRRKEEPFEEEGTQTESSQSPAVRSPSSGPSQPKRRSTRIVDMENREKAEKILQENRLKEQEAKEAMLKSTEKDAETPDEGKVEPRVGRKPKKKRGRIGRGKGRREPEEEDEEGGCDAEDGEKGKVAAEKPKIKGKRGRKPAGTVLSLAMSAPSSLDAEGVGEVKKEQKSAAGKPGRKKKVNPQAKQAEREQKSEQAEDETSQDFTCNNGQGDIIEKPVNMEHTSLETKPATSDVDMRVTEVKQTEVSTQKMSALVQGQSKFTSHWRKGMKIKTAGRKVLSAHAKKGKKVNSEGVKDKQSSEEDDLPLKAFTKGLKKEIRPTDKGDRIDEQVGGKQKQQKGLLPTHRTSSEGERPILSGDKKKVGTKQASSTGTRGTIKQVFDDNKLKSPEGREKKVAVSMEVKTPEKADGKARTIKSGEKVEDSHCPKQHKHKHRKSEEIIIDPTVTDLFKPDGIIPTDPVKKEETDAVDGKGQHHNITSVVKVEPAGEGMQVAQQVRAADVGASVRSADVGTGTRPAEAGTGVKPTGVGGVKPAEAGTGARPTGVGGGVEPAEAGSGVGPTGVGGGVKTTEAGTGSRPGVEGGVKPAEAGGGGRPNGVGGGIKPIEAGVSIKPTGVGGGVKPVEAGAGGRPTSVGGGVKPAEAGVRPTGVGSGVSSQGTEEKKGLVSKGSSHSCEVGSEKVPSANDKTLSTSSMESEHATNVKMDLVHDRVVPSRSQDTMIETCEGNSEGAKSALKSVPKIVKEHGTDLKIKDNKKSGKNTDHKHLQGKSSLEDAGHESGDLSYEDDENDSDWEPAHDPHTLYCICRRPHGNKFMICCDKCQEWYHGHCVGVSRSQGHQMEQENKEYICPVCTGTVVMEGKGSADTGKRDPPPSLASGGQEGSKKSEGKNSGKRPGSVSKDISSKLLPKEKKEKWKLQRCVANDCRREARLGSVYCSTACIVRHAQDSLRLLHKNTEQASGLKEKVSDRRSSSEDNRVMVLERRSGRVLSGSQAPTEAQLEIWLETHPTFEVLQPSVTSSFYKSKEKDKPRKHRSSHGQIPVKKVEEKKEADSGANKHSKSDDGPDLVRLNVRKTLRDALATRAEDADDIMLSTSEIKHLALAIEEELFKVYNSTGHKYRAKYRTLLFNLKDQKNKGLYRKVLTGKIKPSHLVKMTTEELASRELAKWREMEVKHALEMIEQTEKEAMKGGQHHIRKKTHKGEVEVEDEDMSTLVSRVEEQKTKPESKEEETTASTVVDTTDQHRTHLFDLNCKICTGKVLPPAVEETSTKPKSMAHTVSEEEEDKAIPAKTAQEKKERETKPDAAALSARYAHSSDGEAIVPLVSQRTPSLSHVTVGSPDSALQSGLESKPKFTPSGPMLWKGFISMQDFAKFFTSAYKVSGPVENLTLPDTVQICGRISPDQMWDYLGKIRQAGSRDICILRFIPGSDDEKVAYVHLYSYLNSRGRCGVVGNVPKDIKDLYLVPLASHSKIPQVLLPFDGPGLESNRPHMLVGIIVRQKSKRPIDWQPPSKTTTSTTGSHDSPSQNKKMRMSSKDTEAYSPTAQGEDTTGHEPLYIPTPTVAIHRSNASATSSSSSTPSSSDRGSSSVSSATLPLSTSLNLPSQKSSKVLISGSRKDSRRTTAAGDGAEPYSPSNIVEADAPYDPEDESQFVEMEVSSSIDDVGAIPESSSTGPEAQSREGSSKEKSVSREASSVSTSSSLSVDSIVQKISASTSPQEISALMVTALASAKNSAEQQQLLALLASRVEQQKKINAKKKFKDKQSQPVDGREVLQSETCVSASDLESQLILSSSSVNTELSSQSLSTSAGPPTVQSPSIKIGVTLAGQQSINPAQSISRISSLTPDTENMPLALKALMEDLKGNTQMSKAVDKRTERDRRDLEKKESSQLAKDIPAKVGQAVSNIADQTDCKAETNITEGKAEILEPIIPGLGGVEDEVKGGNNMTVNTEVIESNSIFGMLASSKLAESDTMVRTGPADSGDQLKIMGLNAPATLALGDTDLRQLVLPGLDSKFSGSAEQVSKSDEVILSLQDQDDRFPPKTGFSGLPSSVSTPSPLLHPSLPPRFAASHRLPTSPGSSLHSLHSQHPLDIQDVDHRRPPLSAGSYSSGAVGLSLFSSRTSTQPPPPGTEMEDTAMVRCFGVVGVGDVDMRQQAPKRGGAPLTAGDQSVEKVPRRDSKLHGGITQQPPPLPPLPPQPPPPPPPLPSTSLAAAGPDPETGRILPEFGDRSGSMTFRPEVGRHGKIEHPSGGVAHREESQSLIPARGDGTGQDYHPRQQHSSEHHPRYSPLRGRRHYHSSPHHHRYGQHASDGNRHSKNSHLNRGRH